MNKMITALAVLVLVAPAPAAAQSANMRLLHHQRGFG